MSSEKDPAGNERFNDAQLSANIYLGIRLGSAGMGAELMVSSQNGMPVENWTLFFIATSITLVMYANWAFNNRSIRFRPSSFLVAAASILRRSSFSASGDFMR